MSARTNRLPRSIARHLPRLPLVAATVFAAPLAAPLLANAAQEAAAAATPVELGQVDWQRDLGGALAQSKSSGKPLAVLFQEVPG